MDPVSPIAERARERSEERTSRKTHVAQTDNEKVGEHLRKLRPWARDAVMGWEPGTSRGSPLNVIADEQKLAVHRAKIDRSPLTDVSGFDE